MKESWVRVDYRDRGLAVASPRGCDIIVIGSLSLLSPWLFPMKSSALFGWMLSSQGNVFAIESFVLLNSRL